MWKMLHSRLTCKEVNMLVMNKPKIFREGMQKAWAKLNQSPKHVISGILRNYYDLGKPLHQKVGLPYPFKNLDDVFATLHLNFLAKKNFPYLNQANEAIMKFWEGGLIRYVLWINDGMEG